MTSPVKNHNKGPIGPLDPDEPCPFDPNLRWYHRLTIADAYRALRSMGVELKDQEIERAIAEGTGPQHTVVGQRIVDWGEMLNWASRTFPKEKLTRKEAVEYLHSIGCPMSKVTLQQLGKRSPPYRFVGNGLKVWYEKEDLDKWWAKAKTTWPTQSFAPKYRPLNYATRCPEYHRDKGHCPNTKHESCAKYPRALCNIVHLPVRPGEWLPATCAKIIDGKWVFYRVIDGKMVIVNTLEHIDGKWVVVKSIEHNRDHL